MTQARYSVAPSASRSFGHRKRRADSASIQKSGPAYEQVWRKLVQPEKDRDPDKKGFAVLIKVERAEDLEGLPLTLD